MKTIFIIFILSRFFLFVISDQSSQIPQPPHLYIRKSQSRLLPDRPPNKCPCLKESQKCPPCNSLEFTKLSAECPCAPKFSCPPCILAKTQKFLHEEAEKEVNKIQKNSPFFLFNLKNLDFERGLG